MGVWLDRLIISAVVVVGIVIMYKALKEPIDLLFGVIKKGFIGIKDMIVNAKDNMGGGYEVITYGQ